MARVRGIHLLSAVEVHKAKADMHDGGGLLLRVKADGGASWVLRFTSPTGRRREMGLGVCHRHSTAAAGQALSRARGLSAAALAELASGIDPLEARRQRAAELQAAEAAMRDEESTRRAVEHWTLARCARDYHARVVEPNRTTKHAAQWIASLENHIPPKLWHAPIVAVTRPELVEALLSIKPHKRARNFGHGDKLGETRDRILQRLAAVWDDAVFHGRAADNPAGSATRRKVAEGAKKRQRGEHRALAYGEAPTVMQMIRGADGVGARALEFAVLTASRTGEVLGARWDEFDIDKMLWRLPAERMKAGKPHDVPLSAQAVTVLGQVRGLNEVYVFPSPTGSGRPLSNMAMLTVLTRLGLRQRTTVHGLARATFSTWANNSGVARPDVVEAALAHAKGDKVRAAYDRATYDDERRALLSAWSDYLDREAAPVIALHAA